jgi:hypothetical protein
MQGAFQGSDQSRPLQAQLILVMERELAQDLLSRGSKREQYFAAILAAALAADVASRREPVDQFHCAVVLDLQSLRQFADPGANALRQSLQSQHELMLARLEAGVASGLFAEAQEAAYLVAEFRQRLIIGFREALCHAVNYIVLRYFNYLS